ncbi:hypothetical protein PLEOSDRAFT_161887 [Pleurotus ostreatus PC15]|uniref:Uncharacterized protein n=2 Tax=Pleurotus TaxID=5320 RepID=A0A067NKL4_PLEO1|nr:hypothetical protein CCMSSC00406_0009802 [Pleurotus cornucopiae]KDQ24131.1 hypothetical protein PLEOSDRAFT_161887 [Pleurotus ostreatus PC15]
MAPLSKSTPEQNEFLLKLVDEFLEAQKKGKLVKFWVQLFGSWFQKWEIVEDPAIKDVAERQKAHGEAILAKKAYLRRWYQNHAPKKARKLPFGRFAKLALQQKKRKHCLQLLEVYCRLFYKDRIISHVKAEVDRLTILNGCKPTRGMKLCLVRKYAVALYELEPAEIKSEVEAEYKRYKAEVKEAKEAVPTPQSYAQMIDTISKFTLLAGGPDPANGGKIRSFGVHHGTNHAGLSFGEAVPEFKKQITPIFGNFLRTVYTPSECATRALYPADDVGNTASNDVSKAPGVVAASAPLPPPLPVDIQATHWPVEPTQPGSLDDDPTLDPLNENFDALNENIDWDNFRFFDPEILKELSGSDVTGAQPGLSLMEELAAPLPDHILQGFAPVLPAMSPPNEDAPMALLNANENALSTDIPLFNPLMPPYHPLPTMTPVVNFTALPATPTTPTTEAVASAALPSSDAQAQAIPTGELPAATPTSEVESPSDSARAQAVPTDESPATLTTEVATSTATADIASSVTTGAVLKSTSSNQRGQNKRSRDPIDLELIVPGKRARKAKERADADVSVDTAPGKRARKTKGGTATEGSRARGKENPPPIRSA